MYYVIYRSVESVIIYGEIRLGLEIALVFLDLVGKVFMARPT